MDHIDIYADVGEEFNQVGNCARPAFHGDVPSQKWHCREGERPAVSSGRAWLATAGLSAQGEAGAIVDCGAHQRPRATFPPGVWRGCTPAMLRARRIARQGRGIVPRMRLFFPPPLRLFPFLDGAPKRWETMSRRRSLSPKTSRCLFPIPPAPLRRGKLEHRGTKTRQPFLYKP